jgi:hypothetical protein
MSDTNLFVNCAVRLRRDCDYAEGSAGVPDPLAIARVVDIRAVLDECDELIAVVRGACENLPVEAVFVTKCDVLVVDTDWYYDWRDRAEALLSRLEADGG